MTYIKYNIFQYTIEEKSGGLPGKRSDRDSRQG